MKTFLFATLVALAAVVSTPAHAFNLGINAGMSAPSGTAMSNAKSPAMLLGAELTFGLDILSVGGFYEQNWVSFKTPITTATGNVDSGTGRFFGAVGRVGFPMSGFFADLKVGFNSMSTGGTSTDSAFGFGLGAGYKMDLGPLFSLSPRLGYRSLPTSQNGTSTSGATVDFGLLAQVGF